MEPENLYEIYKRVKQRVKRAKKSAGTQQKGEVMLAAAACINEKQTLKLVKEFRKAEELWRKSGDVSSATTSLADQFESAIRSGHFVVEKWQGNTHANGYNPDVIGLVYCAMVPSKPGQLKIGVTTQPQRDRLKQMENRHGHDNIQPLFSIKVFRPYEIEDFVQNRLISCHVGKYAKGDSKEWYYASPIEVARDFQAAIEQKEREVKRVVIYANCPDFTKVKTALSQLGKEVITL